MDNPSQGAPVPENADQPPTPPPAPRPSAPPEPPNPDAATETEPTPTAPQATVEPAPAQAATPEPPNQATPNTPEPATAGAPANPETQAPAPESAGTADPGDDRTPLFGIPVQPGSWYQQQQSGDPVTSPIPRIRATDPVAAAIGNASLLGVGYLLMRRAWFAVGGIVLTAVLLVLLATEFRTTWFEIVVLVWWVAQIAHGWVLAGRRAKRITSRGQRITAAVFAVVVLLVFGLLRWDAASIGGDLDDARAAGDCPKAQDAISDIWFAHHVVDAPMTVDAEHTAEACARLSTAKAQFSNALINGTPTKLQRGVLTLLGVLTDLPGHERMVERVFEQFLNDLPTADPCDIVQLTDQLRQLRLGPDLVSPDRVKDVLAKVEPGALTDCADTHLADGDWAGAQTLYQQLIDSYPDDPGVKHAKAGIAEAELSSEYEQVSELVDSGDYCAHPARYSAAPAYKKGTNRGYFIGQDNYVGDLPGAWKTDDLAKAALMVCLGNASSGPVVRTCPYVTRDTGEAVSVSFHKIAIPVRGYALRTGKKVIDTTIQISGTSCPQVIDFQGDPPTNEDVSPSKAGVQLAFRFLVVR